MKKVQEGRQGFILNIGSVTLTFALKCWIANCFKILHTKHLFEVISQTVNKNRCQEDGKVFSINSNYDLDLGPSMLKRQFVSDIAMLNICVSHVQIDSIRKR